MNLASNDFELFGLAPVFAVNPQALEARWRALQTEVHPDRFAADGATAQRAAMQASIRVNEAHRRLRDPVARAACLCELRGAPIEAERNTAMPADFLMQQIAWREALDDARDIGTVESIAREVAEHRRHALVRLAATLDVDRDPVAAAAQVRALMFVDRFLADLDLRLESLGA